MRILRNIALGFLIIIVLIFCIIAGFFVFEKIQQHRADSAARTALPGERARAEKEDDAAVEKRVDFLEQSGLVSDRIGSAKVDTCYGDHDDAGWMISSWYQECQLKYIEGFSTNLPKDTLLSSMAQLPDATKLFGEQVLSEYSFDNYPSGCVVYRSVDTKQAIEVVYLPQDYNSAVVEEYSSCNIPKQGDRYAGAIASESATKVFRSFNPNALSHAKAQVWVVVSDTYYHEDLGCTGILCDNPRPKPIQAP